ncbi:MAG: hypothetical protein IAE78_03220 [Myxococcus sp.]|nr:hypothetical protein [Myxococcus sp.]
MADPSNPQAGLFVSKFRCDPPIDYVPSVGDVLTLRGYVGQTASFVDREAYRVVLKSQFDFLPSGSRPSVCSLPGCQPLEITRTGAMSPPPAVPVSSSFGNAQGGLVAAEPTRLGAFVHIAGPLTLTVPNPAALQRVSSAGASDPRFYGFELSSGLLIGNFRTFSGFVTEDGGLPNCDWRQVVLDGGSVTFPAGVRGIWDSYSHAPCADGGIQASCFRAPGFIPGGLPPGGGAPLSTHVLWPLDCADLPGFAQ